MATVKLKVNYPSSVTQPAVRDDISEEAAHNPSPKLIYYCRSRLVQSKLSATVADCHLTIASWLILYIKTRRYSFVWRIIANEARPSSTSPSFLGSQPLALPPLLSLLILILLADWLFVPLDLISRCKRPSARQRFRVELAWAPTITCAYCTQLTVPACLSGTTINRLYGN